MLERGVRMVDERMFAIRSSPADVVTATQESERASAMSASADGNVTTVVIERRPGLVYVKLAEPMLRPERVEPLLRQTIKDWFGAHPRFVIDRSEPVVDNGVLRGIHVSYHVI